MDIATEKEGKALIVNLEGRIDGNNAHDFLTSLTDSITEKDTIVILDLSNLSYISSAGLRAVLLTAKDLKKQDAQFMLCALNPSVKGIFQVSGFDKIIAIHESRADALGSLDG